jgi:hypothetical protein
MSPSPGTMVVPLAVYVKTPAGEAGARERGTWDSHPLSVGRP